MDKDKIRWGILGTGYISDKFTGCLKIVKDSELAAVASRDLLRAKAFAKKYNIKKHYGSYQQMAMDKDIDIIYIGIPHTSHLKYSLMFMEKGFNVLCEKPLGVNAKQVTEMIKKAREKDVFLMEGMWTRFFPAVKKGLEWVKNGSIGTPKTLFSNFGMDVSDDRQQWRFQRSMAGGALLDVGIYPLTIAFAAFGTDPVEITTSCYVENGIDEYSAFTFKYEDGKIAVLGSALSVKMENKVIINGTKGSVVIGAGNEWWRTDKAQLLKGGDNVYSFVGGKKEVFEKPYDLFGFQYEAEAVANYVRTWLKEAPEMPLDESLKIVKMMDKLRNIWNVVYDAD